MWYSLLTAIIDCKSSTRHQIQGKKSMGSVLKNFMPHFQINRTCLWLQLFVFLPRISWSFISRWYQGKVWCQGFPHANQINTCYFKCWGRQRHGALLFSAKSFWAKRMFPESHMFRVLGQHWIGMIVEIALFRMEVSQSRTLVTGKEQFLNSNYCMFYILWSKYSSLFPL